MKPGQDIQDTMERDRDCNCGTGLPILPYITKTLWKLTSNVCIPAMEFRGLAIVIQGPMHWAFLSLRTTPTLLSLDTRRWCLVMDRSMLAIVLRELAIQYQFTKAWCRTGLVSLEPCSPTAEKQ